MCTCSGDKPLSEALQIMNSEGITSLVVVDNHMNVIGNISATDVKVLRHILLKMLLLITA
jgi:CBS domain-containing protein